MWPGKWVLPLPWVAWVPARPSVRLRASPRGALWGVSPPSWVPRHGGARPDAPPPPHPHLWLPPGPMWVPRWCLLDPRPGLFLRGGALGGLGAGAGWPPDSGGPAVPSLHTDLPHTVPQSLTLLPALGLRPGPCAGPWPALSPPRTVPRRHPLTDSGSLGDTSWASAPSQLLCLAPPASELPGLPSRCVSPCPAPGPVLRGVPRVLALLGLGLALG